jgi:hypothetical protein
MISPQISTRYALKETETVSIQLRGNNGRDPHSTGRMNPSLELSCRHPGDRYPFHGGLGHCVVNSYLKHCNRSGPKTLNVGIEDFNAKLTQHGHQLD